MKLTLHEAIVEVLKTKLKHTAAIQEIADEINEGKLYSRKDKKPIPAYQIRQRTKLSNGHYHHLFDFEEPGIVTLKDETPR